MIYLRTILTTINIKTMFYGKRLKKIEEQQARIIKEVTQQRVEFERAKEKINALARLVAITHFDTEEYASFFEKDKEALMDMIEKQAVYEGKLKKFIRSTMTRKKPKPKTDGKEANQKATE